MISRQTSKLLDAIRAMYRSTDLSLFPRAALEALRSVISCDFATYTEIDLRREYGSFVCSPPEILNELRRVEPAYWKWKDQHPFTALLESGLEFVPRALREFITLRALQKLEIYHQFLLPLGIVDTLIISIRARDESSVLLGLNRVGAAGRFTARDLGVATLLSPHLVQAFENASAFAENRASGLFGGGTPDVSSHGLLMVDRDFHLIHCNDAGRDLLRECFGVHGTVLPDGICEWLRRIPAILSPRRPLVLPVRDGKEIIFRSVETESGGWLIAGRWKVKASPFQFTQPFGLTMRESEVLHWATHGKSNPEIGTILQASPRTIDKHMQNLFRKLAVDSRTAAIVMALSSGWWPE